MWSKKFHITDTDKEWVRENFRWLIKTYGYPAGYYKPILFTKEFFPQTLTVQHTAIEPLIADLCKLFDLDPQKISFETEEDIRDSYGTPYEFKDRPFECELEAIPSIKGRSYKLYFAKSLLKHPKRLLFNCVYYFLNIRLDNDRIDEDDNEDASLFVLLAGVYFGYGVILLQTMTDSGKQTDGFWEKKWSYISEMPMNVMVYALALYYNLINEKKPEWISSFPSDIRKDYERAAKLIQESPNNLFNKQELDARQFFYEAVRQAGQNDFDSAIETYQKATFLTQQEHLKATLHNNIGYTLLRKGEYQKSIPHFQKALDLEPNFGYANDNLGFALIMSGDHESGRHYLTIASQTGNNDAAYSYRNVALYHQKKGERNLAEENFKKAFDSISIRVDLLEYLYALFLMESGEKEKAMSYLKIAVDKGEPEAIAFMKELTSSNTEK